MALGPASAADFAQDIDGQRRVLPVALSWRSGEKEAWQPLTKTVLYRLDGKRSEIFNFQASRLKRCGSQRLTPDYRRRCPR
ncbi:transmembrane protein [Klebsiella michiganensis]|nr:transmembrane protein [Klebsiella michiganensis]